MGIELGTLGLFSLAVAVLMITPGADMVFVLSMAISGGARAGVASILGVATGAFCHVLMAVIGLAAIIAASPWLFKGMVIVGALYIAWIGLSIARSDGSIGRIEDQEPTPLLSIFRQGVMTNLLNPKAIIFTLSFIPQFIPEQSANKANQMLFLGGILIIIMIAIEIPLVIFAGKIGGRLQSDQRLRRLINRLAGGTLVVLSCYILFSRL